MVKVSLSSILMHRLFANRAVRFPDWKQKKNIVLGRCIVDDAVYCV